MKRKTNLRPRAALLLLAMLCSFTGAWAQTLFSEDFEEITSLTDAGWTTDGPGTWTIGTGDYSSGTGAGQGTKNALIKHTTRGNATKLITPEINLSSATSAGLSFMHIQRDWGGDKDELKVYYRTSSTGEWTLLEDYTAAIATWTTDEILLPNLSSTYQIAFEMIDGYGYGVGIDDVKIVKGLYAKPTGLTVSGLMATTATVSWTAPAGSPTGYAYQYKKASETGWSTLTTVTATSVLLSGLTANTVYNFRVKAKYGSNESDFTDINFSTTTVPVAVGNSWSDNFEGSSCGWTLFNGELTNTWNWGTVVSNGGTHAIYISNDGGVTNAYDKSSSTMAYATKVFVFDEGKYEFSYDWKAKGEGTYDYLRVALVPTSVVLTAGTTPSNFSSSKLPDGWVALDGGGQLNLSADWKSKSVAVNVSEGYYYLVFAWKNDGSMGTDPPAAIDNVNIRRVTCSADVAGLNVNNITTTSATLAWTGGASQWQVAYSTYGDFADATQTIVSSASYTITGLTPATHYYARVRAYCGGSEYGSWSNVLEFNTDCSVITVYPWSENFDDDATGTLPVCWSRINTSTSSLYSSYPRVYNYESNCLLFSSVYSTSNNYDPKPQYAILPVMENLSGKVIRFNAKGANTSSTFKIGMMTDPNDASTFTQIAEQALTTSYPNVPFEYALTGTGNYVAIMIDAANSSRSDNTLYIDDIIITEAPYAPTNLKATLTPGNGTLATLSWTENGTATNWVLEYGTASDFSGATSVNVSGTPTKNLTGLTPETTYYARVKVTKGGDESSWSNTVTFTPTNDYSVLVNDGTNKNGYVPIYGYYCDKYSMSQFIIPAADLAAMQYGTITNLTFYATNDNISWGAAEFEVYMTEVSETTFSSTTLLDWSGMEKVMNAGTLAISGNKMVITLDAPYQYLGGNLLIGINQTTSGTYASCSWQGVSSSENVALGGYGIDVNNGSNVGIQKFLPKTTINFTPGTAPSVLKPTNLTVNYTGGTTATVSWTSTEPAFDIDVNGTVTQNVTNPYTLTGLYLGTTYTVRVRAKNINGVSDWSSPVSFNTDLCMPEDQCLINITLTDSYNDGWSGNKLEVRDASTNMLLGSFTLTSGGSGDFSLNVCNGREINFVYVASGNFSTENGWIITDINDDIIAQREGCNNGCTPDPGIIATYTVNCTVTPYKIPSNLTASEIGPKSVKLSWTENSNPPATAWIVAYKKDSDTDFTEVNAATNPFVLTGLTSETEYTVKVRPVTDDSSVKWSAEMTFTTNTATPAPTDLAVSHVGPTSATVSWSSFSNANELRYVANPNYANQGYVTNPGAMANGADASWIQGSQSVWGPSAMYSSNTFVADDFTIYSPTTLKEIEVYAYQTGSTTSSTFTGLYALIIEGDPYDDANIVWGDLDNNIMSGTSFTNCYRGSNGATTETTRPIMAITASGLDINLAPGNYWLVYSLTGSGSSGPWAVPFSKPSVGNTGEGLQYSNSAWSDLSDSGSGTPYGCAMKLTFNEDIESLPWTTITDINADEYNLTGLNPETFYLVQVRSNYGSDGVSNWTTLDFTTLETNPVPTDVEADLMANSAALTWTGYGDSYNVRYRTAPGVAENIFFEGFENGIPATWTTIDADGDGNNWLALSDIPATYASYASLDLSNWAHNGNNAASSPSFVNNVGSFDSDQYLISPKLNLQGTLRFYAASEYNDEDSYEVLLSTTGTDAADFTVTLQAMKEAPFGSWEEVNIDLSAYAGQQGYIAIRHNSSDKYFLVIDDFGIYNAIPAGPWSTLPTSDAAFTLTGLASNTVYDYQIQSVSVGLSSEWTDIQSFALLNLPSDADNTGLILNSTGRQAHVTFTGNTLYKDAAYNTMCLPIDLNVEEEPFTDATIKILDSSASSYDTATKTLTVTFKAFTGDVIPAGTPFIVKWATGSNITNPYFANVIVGTSAKSVVFTDGEFAGSYKPVTLSDKAMYFGSDKPQAWPSTNTTVNAFKAHIIPDDGDVERIIINFGDGTQISVSSILGDTNGDADVTISDAVGVANYILGKTSAGFNILNANVNGDVDGGGKPKITISDAVGIVNMILNK